MENDGPAMTADERAIFASIEKRLRDQMREKKPVTSETDLRRDIGMYGEDALEFLEWYNQEFGVDMQNFEFAKHFEDEGYLRILLGQIFGKPKVFYPVTVGMLTGIARAKVWPRIPDADG